MTQPSSNLPTNVSLANEEGVIGSARKYMQIPRCVYTAEEAVEIVREHRTLWLAEQAARR